MGDLMAYRLSVSASGTWTPTLTGGTAAGSTTYTTQTGDYSLIGNILTCTFVITITAATGTGNARIGNLPFNIKSGTQDFTGPVLASSASWTWPTSTTDIVAKGTAGNSYVEIFCFASGVASSQLQMTNAAFTIWGNLQYRV